MSTKGNGKRSVNLTYLINFNGFGLDSCIVVVSLDAMGKLKCFEIVFSENKTVYHPGERVTGLRVVELKGDMRMRALRVFVRGIAKVHWTESRSTGTRLGSYTEHYNAEVEYFFDRQVLFGGGKYVVSILTFCFTCQRRGCDKLLSKQC